MQRPAQSPLRSFPASLLPKISGRCNGYNLFHNRLDFRHREIANIKIRYIAVSSSRFRRSYGRHFGRRIQIEVQLVALRFSHIQAQIGLSGQHVFCNNRTCSSTAIQHLSLAEFVLRYSLATPPFVQKDWPDRASRPICAALAHNWPLPSVALLKLRCHFFEAGGILAAGVDFQQLQHEFPGATDPGQRIPENFRLRIATVGPCTPRPLRSIHFVSINRAQSGTAEISQERTFGGVGIDDGTASVTQHGIGLQITTGNDAIFERRTFATLGQQTDPTQQAQTSQATAQQQQVCSRLSSIPGSATGVAAAVQPVWQLG